MLVVEDDSSTRDFLAELLAMNGFRVVTAVNGLEALEKLRQNRPCAVLLDLTLSLLDGRLFIRVSQNAAKFWPPVPIICISGMPSALQEAQVLGAQACVIKPIDAAELIEHVERYCQRAA